MVNHLHALDRLDLNRRHVTIGFETEVLSGQVVPCVGLFGLYYQILFQGDHQIGLADMPVRAVVENTRSRGIGLIALRRAVVHPFGNGRDLFVAERNVVLEFLDSDVLVDMPRRHVAGNYLLLDGSRPGPRLLIGEKRHRSDLAGPVAGHAVLLQNRRNILFIGDRIRGDRSRWRLRASGINHSQ